MSVVEVGDVGSKGRVENNFLLSLSNFRFPELSIYPLISTAFIIFFLKIQKIGLN
jgi:hypothetical protein